MVDASISCSFRQRREEIVFYILLLCFGWKHTVLLFSKVKWLLYFCSWSWCFRKKVDTMEKMAAGYLQNPRTEQMSLCSCCCESPVCLCLSTGWSRWCRPTGAWRPKGTSLFTCFMTFNVNFGVMYDSLKCSWRKCSKLKPHSSVYWHFYDMQKGTTDVNYPKANSSAMHYMVTFMF